VTVTLLADTDLLRGLATLWPCLGILLAAVLSGFFSGAETGAYRVNRVRLRLARQHGRPGATWLSSLVADMPGLICVTLIGTNVGVYVASVLMTGLWHERAPEQSALWAEMMATLALTPILFVVSEVLPKNIFNAEADRLMYLSARPLYVLRRIFGWLGLVGMLKGISRVWTLVRRWREGKTAEVVNPFPAQARLRAVIRDSAAEGVMTPYQNELVEKIMSLRDVHVGEVMVPLSRVVRLRSGETWQGFLDAVRANAFSRLPVMDASRRRAVGVVPVNEVLEAMTGGEQEDWESFSRPAVILPPQMTVTQAIFALQRNRTPLAIVSGAQGQTIGIVTLKDLAEEIVGELEAW
jgi:CBS domain containing-hemolysin-like protein